MVICTKSGREICVEISSYYDSKFGSFVSPRCLLCIDHPAVLADLSFGDAWLPEVKAHDQIGTSVIISRTKSANEILIKAMGKGCLRLLAEDIKKIKASQGNFSTKRQGLKARLNLKTFFRKKVPCYHQDFPNPSKADYFYALLLYSQMFLAAKPSLWWLLDAYSDLLSIAARVKRFSVRKISRLRFNFFK